MIENILLQNKRSIIGFISRINVILFHVVLRSINYSVNL